MAEKWTVERMKEEELEEVRTLVWTVFSEFEAPEYSNEGVQEFQEFIALHNLRTLWQAGELEFLVCRRNQKIIGVLSVKNGCHISLFFVDKAFHRRGVARSLYEAVLKANPQVKTITVNSSPYAVPAYERMGFVPTDEEQLVHGIRFIPMKHTLV